MWIITFGKKVVKEKTRVGADMYIRILEANGIEYSVQKEEI